MKLKKGLMGQNGTQLTTDALRRNTLPLALPQPLWYLWRKGVRQHQAGALLISAPALLCGSPVPSNGLGTLPKVLSHEKPKD